MGKGNQTPDEGLGLRQYAGPVTSGSLVYYFLPDGSPNAGKPRPATVVRAHQNEQRDSSTGQLPLAVDLIVAVLVEDQVSSEQLNIPKTFEGNRNPGTWDWQAPQENGF